MLSQLSHHALGRTHHLRSRRSPDDVFVVSMARPTPRRRNAYVCDTFAETGSCPRGAACPDAHVPLHNARRLVPHVRDRVSGDASAAHQRYASALGYFTVAQPNAGAASVHVRADECLVTRAIGADGRVSKGVTVLNVCAHFQRKGACDYGAECSFVHPLGAFTHVNHACGQGSVLDDDISALSQRRSMAPPPTCDALPDATKPAGVPKPAAAEAAPDAPPGIRAVCLAAPGPRPAAAVARERFVHEPYGAPTPGWRGPREKRW